MLELQLNWAELVEVTGRLTAAFLLAIPIAWDRERETRSMGLRTFPLVSIASCAYALVAVNLFGVNADAQARIIQGLMTGIGFIGGGAILKNGASVRGTATAASVWSTGAMGAAVAYGLYEIAIIICAVGFASLRLLTTVKDELGDRGDAPVRALRDEPGHSPAPDSGPRRRSTASSPAGTATASPDGAGFRRPSSDELDTPAMRSTVAVARE